MDADRFAFSLPDPTSWRKLARHEPLALLVDLDGTLINFAATPEQATLDQNAHRVLQLLLETGVFVVIVSGRQRAAIEPLIDSFPDVWWFAEHGVWHTADGIWTGPTCADVELDDLAVTLTGLAATPGARFERKTMAVGLHWRSVEHPARPALVASAELACDEWLETHPDYERLFGVDHLEVRRRSGHKGHAVRHVRQRVEGARVIAIGDDLTDEDMFAELRDGDAGIVVGHQSRQSRAHATVTGPVGVRAFLHWVAESRRGVAIGAPPIAPVLEVHAPRDRGSLVVMSNRTPSTSHGRQREVGGLVSALEPAIRDRRGIWLGWSGREHDGARPLVIDALAQPPRASFDLSSASRERFYAGFCNRVLWPLFHGFPGRVTYHDADWEAFVAANETYARNAMEIAQPDATIWVHDYHLLLAARELRKLGHTGPIGLFLHIPFPTRDLFETIPWHRELLDAMLDFTLIGFHTPRWAEYFLDAARAEPQVSVHGELVRSGTRRTSVATFPIPIDPAAFSVWTEEASDVSGLRTALGDRRLLLGVDRLDYAKGIPERLVAFERLLEKYPRWRGRVSFVQISVPSRAEIPDYAELRDRVENLVGRINGTFGEADWVPVRYLYRSYDHLILAQLYRLADVALVTPLRDGMNLVAKEFVAAQNDLAPGVLVLSRFAGAAVELCDALLTNPFHPDGLADDIDRALQMPREERVARHARLRAAIESSGTPQTWASAFLERLVARPERPHDPRMPAIENADAHERDRLS